MTDLEYAAQKAHEALISQLDGRADAIDVLSAALHRSPEITHSERCWSWGPKHYECALRHIERLTRERLP